MVSPTKLAYDIEAALLQQLLERAADEPVGLLVYTNNPIRLMAKLYQTKSQLQDPRMALLRWKPWDEPGTLGIFKAPRDSRGRKDEGKARPPPRRNMVMGEAPGEAPGETPVPAIDPGF